MTTDRDALVSVRRQLKDVMVYIDEQLTGGGEGVPQPPSPGGGYVNEIVGQVPGPGKWWVGFGSASDPAAVQDITIPEDWPNATVYCGDPGANYMVMQVEGVGTISNGTPQFPFPGKAGKYRVTVVQAPNMPSTGAGPAGFYIRSTP